MDHTIEKSQQIEFVSNVLPALFHPTPEQFLYFLERDGNKFLRFYWDQAGKNLGRTAGDATFGLNYDVRRPQRQVSVVLIRLPQPQNPGETYFAALVYRPYRITSLFMVSDTTQIFTLEKSEIATPATRLAEWTRRIQRKEIGPGPQPVLDDFYQAVLEKLKE